jgi:hypothetical protein
MTNECRVSVDAIAVTQTIIALRRLAVAKQEGSVGGGEQSVLSALTLGLHRAGMVEGQLALRVAASEQQRVRKRIVWIHVRRPSAVSRPRR